MLPANLPDTELLCSVHLHQLVRPVSRPGIYLETSSRHQYPKILPPWLEGVSYRLEQRQCDGPCQLAAPFNDHDVGSFVSRSKREERYPRPVL